jgi:hypothetical protein
VHTKFVSSENADPAETFQFPPALPWHMACCFDPGRI